MNSALVTGAAGFIGSHISERLLGEGFYLIGIDDLNDYYSPILKNFNLSFLTNNKNFEFIQADILDKELIFKIIKQKKPDYLIHCAARAGVRASLKSPLLYTEVNVIGTAMLLEALRLYSSKTKVILLSSASVYGFQKTVPFSEENEPNPQSPYGASKYAMEVVAGQYHSFYHLPIVVIRPFSIYGPRGRVDMAPFLIIKAAETGRPFVKFGSTTDNKRDWTYIDDFVDGLTAIVEKNRFDGFKILNFGNNKPVGIDEFVGFGKHLIKKYLGKELIIVEKPRGKEELPITYANISKAKKLIGYQPKTRLKTGLELFFKYYFRNRKMYLRVWKSENKSSDSETR